MIPLRKMVYLSTACKPMPNKPVHSLLVQDYIALHGLKLWCILPGCKIGQQLMHLIERLPTKWEMVRNQISWESRGSVLWLTLKTLPLGNLIFELVLVNLLDMILRAKDIVSTSPTNTQWQWNKTLFLIKVTYLWKMTMSLSPVMSWLRGREIKSSPCQHS